MTALDERLRNMQQQLSAIAGAMGVQIPPLVEPGVACFTDARMAKFRALLRDCPVTAEHPCNVAAAQRPPGFIIRYRDEELGEILAHFPETVDGVPIYLKPLTEMRTIADIQRRTPNTVTLELPL